MNSTALIPLEKYHELLEATSAYFIIDGQGVMLYVNERFAQTFDTHKDFWLGRKWIEFLTPESAKIARHWYELLEAGKELEFCLQTALNQLHWFKAHIFKDVFPSEYSHSYWLFCQEITAQKKAEAEAIEAQQRVNLLLEATFESITFLDKGICVEANEATSKLLGYSHEEMLGMHATDVIVPQDREMVRQKILNQDETPYTANALRKDGSSFIAEIQGKTVVFQGKFLRVTSLRDITARLEAEQAARVRERQLQAINNSLSGVAIYQIVKPQGAPSRYTYYSRNSEKLYGISSDELLQNRDLLYQHVHPDDLLYVRKLEEEALRELTTFKAEFRQFKRNGEMIWLQVTSVPDVQATGEIIFNGVAIDITARKKAEEQIRQNEIRLSTIHETLNYVAIFQIEVSKDKIAKYLYVSPNVKRILGFSEEAILQNAELLHSRIHPEDLDELITLQKRAFRTKRTFKGEFRFLDSENEQIWLYIHSIPFVQEDGTVHYNGLMMDITGQKRTEAILRSALSGSQKLNEELIASKAELAASKEELTYMNQILGKSNEELSKTNEELDKFVYSVSHDLRAPIASALGLINLMRFSPTEDELYEYLQLLEGCMKRLDDFISEILDYSQNTRLDLKIQAINFEKIVQDTFANYAFLENSSKISKSLTIKGNAPFYSDEKRLMMVFNNLISNAIRYTDLTKIEAFIKINVHINEQTAQIEIEDNGIGIGQDHLLHVFEMFYRATDARTGAGLGLYIVKEAIEKLKGKIELHSILGKGTTFQIEIPNEKI
jgi:PAS domain S-box-containing protein